MFILLQLLTWFCGSYGHRQSLIVFRFGKLFCFLSAKSFPFWETLSGCKVTKIN